MEQEKTLLQTLSGTLKGIASLMDNSVNGTNNFVSAYGEVGAIAEQSAKLQRVKMLAESEKKHEANMERIKAI